MGATLSGALAATLVVACTDSGTAPGAVRDTLRVVQAVPVTSFYQNVDFGRPARRVTEAVHEKLIDFDYVDGKFAMAPRLATEWTQTSPTTWRFTLRDNVKFSDGSDLDAKDVVASFSTLIGSETSVYKPFVGSYKLVAVDDLHVDVESTSPDALVPLHMSMVQIVPSEYGDEAARVAEGDKPVGTGPYTVAEFKKGTEIKLRANENYWGEKPKIKNIDVRFASDPASRVSELETGQADLVDSVPALLESRVTGMKDAEIRKTPTLVKIHLVFNSLKPPANSVELRQAMNYAIDRQQILELFRGNAEPLYGAFAPGEPGYSESYQPFPYDQAKAKELLQKAGLNNPEIVIGHSIGEVPQDKNIAENLQAQLKAVGIQAKLSGGPLRTTNRKFIEGQQPGAYLVQNGPVYPDPEFTFRAHMGLKSTYGKAYGSAKVDDLMAKVLGTADPAAREDLYRQIQEIGITQEAFWLPLVALTDVWGASKGLNWKPLPDQFYRFETMSFS